VDYFDCHCYCACTSWLPCFRVDQMRAFVALSCITLAGCSSASEYPKPPPYVPPSAPSPAAQLRGAKSAAQEEKLTSAVEISDLRASDHGFGRYLICMRGVRGSGPVSYYSVFFDNDTYQGVRVSVTYESCERQSYRPLK
jgi:hypothetical protein